MRRSFIWRTLVICLVGALAGKAIAGNTRDGAPSVFQLAGNYVSARFTVDDGLNDNVVNNVVQSPDGFLWLADSEILSRFDGRDFMVAKPPGEYVTAVAVSKEGDLWIAVRHELERIPADRLSLGILRGIHYRIEPELSPDDDILWLHLNRNGAVWAGSKEGLYRLEGDVLKLIVPGIGVERIEEATNGHLLVVTAKGFMVWDGTRIVPHDEVAAQLGVKPSQIYHVFEDSHGVTWFCTDKGVARSLGGSIEKLQPWRRGNAIYHVQEDPRGNVWFGGVEGLFRARAEGLEQVIAKLQVRSIYGDRDGDLWVGTNGQGLIRLRERIIRMFTTEDGLPSNVAMAVLASHDGALWAGFNCGGLSRFDGRAFHTYKERDGLLNTCVWSLAEDVNHDLWIGTYGGGAFRFRNGSFKQYTKAAGLASNVVFGVIAARDGSLWFGTQKGLSRLRDGHFSTYTRRNGLSSDLITSLREDHTGSIWVGTVAGVDRLVGDRFVNVSLTNAPSLVIGEDSAGTFYWNALTGGVFHLENGTPVKSLPKFHVSDLIKSEQGDMWLVGFGGSVASSGMIRLPEGSLRRVPGRDEPIDYAVFGSADGLGSGEGSVGTPASAISRDGKLWVATTEGLARLDISRLSARGQNPSIYVKEITIGRKQRPADRQLTLPAGTHHLELSFDAIEISAPEKIRLQYRMDGVDKEWLDAAPPGRAVYTNIPPGTHAFRIRATNRAGIWDPVGIAYSVTQQPYFYETTWFRALCVIALLGMIGGMYHLRLRQLARQFNMRLEERVGERTRIARDLHDTLLQSFQGLMLRLQAVEELLPQGNAKEQLEQTLRRADQAIAEGRNAVQDLRSVIMTKNDFAQAVRGVGEELAAQGGAAFRLVVEGPPRDLHPIIREEIHGVTREALRNAFSHSQAQQIEVEITYAEQLLRLRVRDDGVGIEAEFLRRGRPGHYGMIGMRERARQIGARLSFWSRAGAGTEMELTIPGTIAYGRSSKPSRGRLFRREVGKV